MAFEEKRRLERARSPFSPPPTEPENEDWREQMSKENAERVAAMTDEEREEARRQIVERFGANVGDILRRASMARTKQQQEQSPPGHDVLMEVVNPVEVPVPVTSEERKPIERARSPPPSSLASPMSTRPSSRADRQLRFAELEPEDVHVYESAPPSPRRRAFALPPPDPNSSSGATSLGKWKGKMTSPSNVVNLSDAALETRVPGAEEPEEGSAEYIRRKFFPFAPKDDPNLAWMDPQSVPPADSASSSLRFDLHGNPIPPSESLSLPTHLGLHHHAEGTHAGYTLDDIFLLSRSTVPAQRATMLGVLARIARRLGGLQGGQVNGVEELIGQVDELRKRILAAGVEAMSSRGNVGLRAVEVVWECIVGWNPEVLDLEGLELDSPSESIVNTLPLEFFLPQVTTLLSQGGIPSETATQLLSVIHRLAQQSNSIATSIVSTPKLLPTVLQVFLLTPVGQPESPLPDPLALQFFCTLTLSSRSNAQEIEKLADSLLRFVVYSSFDSPYPPALAITLLTSTLALYRALASYGLYCHVAGAAVEQLSHIEQFVISEACTSNALTVAWANLVETWMVCATDPHQTTPPHDIKWSQVVGWNWNTGILELQDRLEAKERDWTVWRASWQAQAAWLEGCKVNSIKGGESERIEFIESIKDGFENGRQRDIVTAALDKLQKDLGNYRGGIFALEFWPLSYAFGLACVPPHWEGPPSAPPFMLPYDQLSGLAQISQFLAFYLLLSRRLPGTTQSLWLAQSFAILLRLIPGDEDYAQSLVKEMTTLLSQTWASSNNIQVSPLIWERGGLVILEPFLLNTIRPLEDVYIGPLTTTSSSIKNSTTQRLSALGSLDKLGLPLHRDWTFMPLDHLLRSGDSAVFKSLPVGWDSSELEVTRSSLFLTKIVQEALLNFSVTPFVLTNDSAEEIFRDGVVGRLMEEILRPYVAGSPDSRLLASASQEDLEKVASKFLGPSVPFFQWYTDFVALYDAISFSHSLYPIDYRKHLWSDFNHVVKTIRISPEHVLSSDIREYFYPIETDPQDNVQEFMRLVALHHIARRGGNDDRASALLKAVVGQGSISVLREICFGTLNDVRTSRMDCIVCWGGETMAARLRGLLN
ncbi:hypothetical protein CPB84DRAFT_1795262 [Gymnopilus junonius]|uniref:RNA polymerase II-associated protein 1 C-terminal domain-containing protein n=1 Tax=Gymnopilus junonius TaxID=109634 RepID=A0A9P5N9V5_GYMJU|nr:hypothetical protein CPB84DRAFT_1795262 [Gymnopilus junonius]